MATYVIHLRSVLFCVSVAAIWAWFNTRPTGIYGGGISGAYVSTHAEFGYPLTVVECYWSAERVWIEELGVYADPTYSYWEPIPVPEDAKWSGLRYGPLLFNIAAAIVICLIATLVFEFISRHLSKRSRVLGGRSSPHVGAE
jgi:hypothetical protein